MLVQCTFTVFKSLQQSISGRLNIDLYSLTNLNYMGIKMVLKMELLFIIFPAHAGNASREPAQLLNN
jgi:hypothetical protein